MLDGYSRRLFHERRNLATLYVWVESLVSKSHSRVDQLVPDPEFTSIDLGEFATIDDLDDAVRVATRG